MSKLIWDESGKRFYQTGVNHGVLYKRVGEAYPKGVAWNGLTAVTESPEGAEATDIYADDIKYLSIRSAENYKATIEALYSPEEFDECDGSAELIAGVRISQQPRKPFGFSWQTRLGNDSAFEDYGYVIHIIYGATVSPSEKNYQTINDSPETMNLSWEIDTIPVAVTGHKATAHLEINSTLITATQLAAIEGVLYGVDAQEAKAAVYAVTSDTTPQTGTTYYTRSGSSPNYTYTQFEGSTFASGTDYYVMTSPAQSAKAAAEPRLPLPDEILSILTAAV